MTTTQELIAQARAGNLEPLKTAFVKAPMTGPLAGSPTRDMEPPTDTTYFEVVAAVEDGELPESVLDQLMAARGGLGSRA